MPVSLLLRCSVALTALAFAGAVLAQPGMMGRGGAPKTFIAGSGPDDLWDVTTKMEMPGMPMAMPPQTNQICIKKGKNTGEESIPKQDNCRVTEMKTVGNKTTFAMECTGDEPMSMRGETTATGTSFDSRMSMKGTRRGNSMDMTMTSSGRRVGACTDQTDKVIAAGKSDYEAQIAKICNEATDKFQFEVFSGQQVCSTRKKAFCDKMGGLAGGMQDRAGFRAVVSKPGVAPVRGSFEFCGLDLVATAKPACASAVGAKDWAFVGNGVCDAEVRAQGPTYCKGRDYYLVDRSLTSLCNRYAALTRGGGAATAGAGGGASGAATAGASGGSSGAPGKSAQTVQPPPPEPPKPDPVKQGVDAVRRLLPF